MSTEMQGTYTLHGVKLPAVMEVYGEPRTVICVDDDKIARYFSPSGKWVHGISIEQVRPLKTEAEKFFEKFGGEEIILEDWSGDHYFTVLRLEKTGKIKLIDEKGRYSWLQEDQLGWNWILRKDKKNFELEPRHLLGWWFKQGDSISLIARKFKDRLMYEGGWCKLEDFENSVFSKNPQAPDDEWLTIDQVRKSYD